PPISKCTLRSRTERIVSPVARSAVVWLAVTALADDMLFSFAGRTQSGWDVLSRRFPSPYRSDRGRHSRLAGAAGLAAGRQWCAGGQRPARQAAASSAAGPAYR